MNITKKEALILGQLVSHAGSELYGLEMVKASDGALKLGTVYATLSRLEQKGFVLGEKEKDSKQAVPRRLYKITGTGRRIFMAWSELKKDYDQAIEGLAV